MENKPAGTSTIKQELKGIRILAAALVVGVIMFTILSVGVNLFSGAFLQGRIETVSQYLFPGMAGLALLAQLLARQQYQKRISAIRGSGDTLRDKIGKYREAMIIYMAICEGMALFSIILFLLSGIYLLLIVTGAMLLLMAARLYAIRGVAAELELSWQEQEELN